MKLLRALLHGLEVGARRPLLVRYESVAHIGVRKRILFASDLHLRKHVNWPDLCALRLC